MQSPASRFRLLNDLVLEWSEQGEYPFQLTLRRICDWAICDAFPEGTFIFANGERVDLLELHRAMRNVIGLPSPISEPMAVELLRRTLLDVTGIRAYCEAIGVDLPKSLEALGLGGRKTFGFRARQPNDTPSYPAPPDCPNG